MIVWDGFKLVGLAICGVIILICVIAYIVMIIAQWFGDRQYRRNQEYWKTHGADMTGDDTND